MQGNRLGEISFIQLKLFWIKVELHFFIRSYLSEKTWKVRKKQGFKNLQETNIIQHGSKGTNLVQNQRLCTCVNTTPHTREKRNKPKRPSQVEGKVSQPRLKPT